MNPILDVSPPPQPEQPATEARLSVLLAYQDAQHERLGRAYCKTLSRHLGWDGNAMISRWKFVMLNAPALRIVAATEAEKAHLVVIATGCADSLPGAVKSWLESWSARARVAPGILAVILSEDFGCSGARWPDYSYVLDKTSGSGRRLVVYASGRSADEDGAFCLADARLVLPHGLAAVEDFAEADELA
jgi:hypothetical protein